MFFEYSLYKYSCAFHLEVYPSRSGCEEVVEQMEVRHIAQKMDAMLFTDVARERVEVLRTAEASKD